MATKKQASEKLIDIILESTIANEAIDRKPVGKRGVDTALGTTKVIPYDTAYTY